MFRTKFRNSHVLVKVLCGLSDILNLTGGCFSRRYGQDLDRKIVPKLIYLHNPWMYMLTKLQLLRLRLLWDRQFIEEDFIRGTKQAAIVMSNSIRDQDGIKIGTFTTPLGFQQITRDMILSKNDIRLKLLHFRVEDIYRAIPMKVILCKKTGHKHCLVDMVFVAMRNIKDFTDSQESQLIRENVYKLDQEMKISQRVLQVEHRILFAEIYIQFYRDYSLQELENWNVSFYKIIAFDVLNYNPKQTQMSK